MLKKWGDGVAVDIFNIMNSKDNPVFLWVYMACLQHSGNSVRNPNAEFHSACYRTCRWHFAINNSLLSTEGRLV
jgi:hypothetical protein